MGRSDQHPVCGTKSHLAPTLSTNRPVSWTAYPHAYPFQAGAALIAGRADRLGGLQLDQPLDDELHAGAQHVDVATGLDGAQHVIGGRLGRPSVRLLIGFETP